ncbi:MAG: hypothetical protein JWL90_3142, partial [Chthoniobacteraceae bacterium]|nr:hypothetical protein [Chthoniobacteraceae bacterium]
CTIVITPKNTLDDSWRQLAQGFLNKYGRPVTFKRDSLSAVWLFETVGRTKSEALYCLANRSKNHAVLIYQDSLLFEKAEADRKKNASTKDL